MDADALPQDLTGALVVAVEDSPAAREALRWAAALATALDRPLHAVTVWNFVRGHAPHDAHPDETPSAARWQAEAERRLQALVAEEVTTPVQLLTLHGNTVPTLLAVAAVADHLVVGSRGRGGFAGLVLGSTSDQLVRYAACPVTVAGRGGTDRGRARADESGARRTS